MASILGMGITRLSRPEGSFDMAIPSITTNSEAFRFINEIEYAPSLQFLSDRQLTKYSEGKDICGYRVEPVGRPNMKALIEVFRFGFGETQRHNFSQEGLFFEQQIAGCPLAFQVRYNQETEKNNQCQTPANKTFFVGSILPYHMAMGLIHFMQTYHIQVEGKALEAQMRHRRQENRSNNLLNLRKVGDHPVVWMSCDQGNHHFFAIPKVGDGMLNVWGQQYCVFTGNKRKNKTGIVLPRFRFMEIYDHKSPEYVAGWPPHFSCGRAASYKHQELLQMASIRGALTFAARPLLLFANYR